jgi:hypothetical protein
VSVLPQLQRELSAAHARRRRRLPRIGLGFGSGAGAVAVAAAVAVAVVVVAVVLVRGGRSPESAGRAPGVVYRGYISSTYSAAGSLYGVVPDRPTSPVSTPPDLVRIDPGSGKVVAEQILAPPSKPLAGGGTDQPIPAPEGLLLAGGSLWATATDSQQTWLWRLDPRSLVVRSFGRLPGGGPYGTGSLALAGGWLWVVNYNTLIRVSPQTGRVAGTRTFSRSVAGLGNGVAADQSGRTLVLTVAGRKRGSRVEVLNPRTGVPIATSAPFSGTTPQLVGVLDGGAWINALAFAGGPERIDLRTLKVTTKLGRAGLPAVVLNGIVEANGKSGRRCVDPVTGRVLATIPAVVSLDGRTTYVQVKRGGTPEIRRETLDPRCLPTP